jgi:transposase
MKKNSIAQVSVKKARHRKPSKVHQMTNRQNSGEAPRQTVGLDLGDKSSRYCVFDRDGKIRAERSTHTTKKGMTAAFGKMARSRIALEVGTHSPWVSRLLESLGHEVIVANARKVRAISDSSQKDDRMDARMLGRLARVEVALLSPIRHRSEAAQQHLAMIRSRAALVDVRTGLVNTARGQTKGFGERLGKCDADQMGPEKLEGLPAGLQAALRPLLEIVHEMTDKIHGYDEELAKIARKQYPETALLEQVSGVGLLIALTFVLTIEDRSRFQRSRDVGCYLGLRPKRQDSGASQPQLGITKEGDGYLRRLLVQGAHHILGARGPDTDLKRWGLRLAGNVDKASPRKGKAPGNKRAKKRAVIAVARKLAILLHRLWVSGEVYEPLRQNQALARPA